MSSHESYYSSPAPPPPPSTHPTSPPSSAPPPPPPPKSLPQQSQSVELSGRGATPLDSFQQQQQQQQPYTIGVGVGIPPPVPPHPNTGIDAHPSSSTQPTQTPQPPPPPPPPPIPSYQQQQTPHNHQHQPTQQDQHQQIIIPPPHPQENWLPPSLPQKSIPDLQHILATPVLLTALAQTHPSYPSGVQPLQSLLSTNLTLANQLASTEQQHRQLRDQTTQLLLNHTSLQTQWRRKQSEMDDALSPWGPRAMYQRLVSSISEQEALLRAMQESFLEGSVEEDPYPSGGNGKATEKEVAEWVRRIREGTTTLEKRREMRARWDEGRVGGWR